MCLFFCAGAAHAQSPTPTALWDVLSSGFGLSVDEDIADSLNVSITEQVATYPVATSSGGFTYEFDPALGIVRRSTRSFGPSFTERALTVGQRNVSFGVNVQHARFDRFEGNDLRRLLLSGTDESSSILHLNITTDTTAFVTEVGVLPRLDVGVVVPFIRVRVAADLEHVRDGEDTSRSQRAGSSSGIGDITAKAKYTFYRRGGGGLAAATEVRLPTGDRLNLRGAGSPRVKLFAIWSEESGMFAPHVNVGITVPPRRLLFPLTHERLGGAWLDVVTNRMEVSYSGGVDVIANARLSFTGDIMGRTKSADRFAYDFDSDSNRTFFTLTTQEYRTQLLGSFGLKLNVHKTLLLTASALVPLNRSGLASRFATVVGFDYGF